MLVVILPVAFGRWLDRLVAREVQGHSRDSNPVVHSRVKEEQAARAILPSQVVLLFFAKFTKWMGFD